MAITDKNIIITPNTGHATASPTILFRGENNLPSTLTVDANGGLTFAQNAASSLKISSSKTKALGSSETSVFSVIDSAAQPLFEVRENGDTVIAGILTVNGTGTSTFAGDVNIGGNLSVDGTIVGGTTVNLAEDLTITGNLVVNGNTTLGDDAAVDTITVKGVTTVASAVTKALGSSETNVFSVIDSEAAPLLEVRQNGDTIIAGILTVNGTGTSTFAGDVSIAGNLTVAGDSTATADLSGTDLTLTGNLIVNGNTTLGNEATDTINLVGIINSNIIPSPDNTHNLGSASQYWKEGYIKTVYSSLVSVDNISIDNNTITTTNTNGNLVLDTNGTGVIILDSVSRVKSTVTKAAGSSSVNVFSVVDSADVPLLEVRQNGDTVIAGILTVNGTGTSTFAGDVSIAGNLTVAGDSTATADLSGTDLTLTGNLVVNGNTTLGDNAATDIVTINGVTSIASSVTKVLGNSAVNVFSVVDSAAAPLFEVRQNGDAVISGSLTVSESATVTADLSSDNLTVGGNLIVNGNTTLGNADTDVVTVTATVSSNIVPTTTLTSSLGSPTKEWNSIYVNDVNVSGYLNSDNITANTVTIAGNLIVAGTTTTVNSETTTIADNIIVLNGNVTGAPVANSGIEIERGTADNKTLLWDEVNDQWTVGAETFVAGKFIGTFEGAASFDSGTYDTLDARYVNTTGDSMTGDLTIAGVLSATSKSFVIDHPTRDGFKLRYGSLEGPENGVYVRGQLVDGTTIELPDYWTGLVDESTISVNLTPIGAYQQLVVVSTLENKVQVECANAPINCYYTIYAERKDVAKMVVEYAEVQ